MVITILQKFNISVNLDVQILREAGRLIDCCNEVTFSKYAIWRYVWMQSSHVMLMRTCDKEYKDKIVKVLKRRTR